MSDHKKSVIQFLVWMRNGSAFCISWILILVLVYSYIFNIRSLPTLWLAKVVFFLTGGVFLFCLVFTQLLIKKWNFVKRLTCFMLSISLYESVGFYFLIFDERLGTIKQWFVFFGIILGLYFISLVIYAWYSKKRGELYTRALQNYQQQRRAANEK